MSREINFNEHNCLLCGKFCINRRSLGNHLTRSHSKMKIKEYVLKFFCEGVTPKCLCGCGKEVEWKKSRYFFNDYVNGHNPAGFKRMGFTPSQKLIDKRNESIRKTYEERKQELSEKISQRVTEAFLRPETKANLIVGQQRYWQTPESRINTSKIRKKQWIDHHEEMCKKIFTPKFRENTSIRNMQRKLRRISDAESHFMEHIESILTNEKLSLVRSKWIKLDCLSKCFDGYIPELDTYLEFDGIFWHGLDRDTNFSYYQIVNMGKDLFTNRVVRDSSMSLLRFREDVSVVEARNLQELRDLAYHVVENGYVRREGTKVLEFNTTLSERVEELFTDQTQVIKLHKHLKNLRTQHESYWK